LKENTFPGDIVELSFEQFSIMLALWSDHDHPIEAKQGFIPENTLKPVKFLMS